MARIGLILLVLAAAIVAVYWPVTNYSFVHLDDPANIEHNPLVTDGLTPGNLYRAVRSSHPDYWRPLTWLSLMIDYELWELDARGYHATNMLLHVLASMMLFGALRALTGSVWRSAAVAALFALHPMHVESVAWVTERKDVLSATFGFAAIWTYATYARRGGAIRYGLVAILFGTSLAAKPMFVTLPCVLLLLDYWPLQRIEWRGAPLADRSPAKPGADGAMSRRSLGLLVVEKAPLFALSALSCLMTLRGGSRSAVEIPIDVAATNVVMSYVMYAVKAFWPMNFAVYYPYPGMFGAEPWAMWQVSAGGALLAGITVLALAMIRRRPYLIVGWLWFLGMLAPVIGIVQVGHQSMADRFSYVPHVGVFVMIVWTLGELALRWPRSKPVLIAAVSSFAIVCTIVAARQVQTWRSSDALYEHALAVTDDNWKAHRLYAGHLAQRGRFKEARDHYDAAAKLHPNEVELPFGAGAALLELGEYYEAIRRFERVLELDPSSAGAHYNLGLAKQRRGQATEATAHFRKAMELNPELAPDCQRALDQLR